MHLAGEAGERKRKGRDWFVPLPLRIATPHRLWLSGPSALAAQRLARNDTQMLVLVVRDSDSTFVGRDRVGMCRPYTSGI